MSLEWWASVHSLPLLGHNQSPFFSDTVSVSILWGLQDDGSHKYQFSLQTIDRRNSISKSFVLPREDWVSYRVDRDRIFRISWWIEEDITLQIESMKYLQEWAESKILCQEFLDRICWDTTQKVISITRSSAQQVA